MVSLSKTQKDIILEVDQKPVALGLVPSDFSLSLQVSQKPTFPASSPKKPFRCGASWGNPRESHGKVSFASLDRPKIAEGSAHGLGADFGGPGGRGEHGRSAGTHSDNP